jgi:trimeric autotransporter adhesin
MVTTTGSARRNKLRGTRKKDVLSGLAGDDILFGLQGNDQLNGGDGNDLLDGGSGRDRLTGGLGDDTYVMDDSGDRITERSNQGNDTVLASINWALGANLENLILAGNATIGIGNELNNVITGNDANNILDGDIGADMLLGGLGDDDYFVDNPGDFTIELANQGFDRVVSTINWTLDPQIESLFLLGGATTGIGNSLDNAITGNNANNTLDGDIGADILSGGLGDDIYFVDNPGDFTIELDNQGFDGVFSTINWTLDPQIESLFLLGGATTGIGNSLDNVITGNDANNILDGDIGADILSGGLGDDLYFVDDTSDIVSEESNEGIDLVASSVTYLLGDNVEGLELLGTADINGIGNDLDNAIVGNSGANVLMGGAGNDTLTGGDGTDFFLIGSTFSNTGFGLDVITDFSSDSDTLVLSKSAFGLSSSTDQFGFSQASEFAAVTNDTSAAVSDAKIVFSNASKTLFYNPNGSAAGFGAVGASGAFVEIPNVVTLSASDFFISSF